MLFVSTPNFDDLPPAPGFPARKQQRRRSPLTRDAIVDAAFAVIAAGNEAELNMRAVAEKLGTGPASLYAHVSGKDELVALMIDRLAVTMFEPGPGKGPWQEQIKEVIRGIRRELGAHRELAFGSLGTIPTGPNSLRIINAMLGVMREAGLPDQVIAFAVDILPLYATATAFEESLQSLKDAGGPEAAQFHEEIHRYFAALPAARFPHIVALADALAAGEGDERFEFGLDALVRGVESMRQSEKPAGNGSS
jgi:AcrR family transcriptional regulator